MYEDLPVYSNAQISPVREFPEGDGDQDTFPAEEGSEQNAQQLHAFSQVFSPSSNLSNSPVPGPSSAVTTSASSTVLKQKGAGVKSPTQGTQAVKWNSQTVYLRIMGRKGAGSSGGDNSSPKPFKPSHLNYIIMGMFSKESNEVQRAKLYCSYFLIELCCHL
jgi:hypothetical protein